MMHKKTDLSVQKQITLLVVVAMTLMATLDGSIVNIAMPVMSEKMRVPLSSIEWISAGYSIVICASLLFFGRLGDTIGKPVIFQFGTVLFTFASLLCGFCHTLFPLLTCRMIQGIGASAYMANNQGIITELYPREGRGKALGILATAVALGSLIGPSAGGVILSVLSWNYIFWINVPIGITVFLFSLPYLPQNKQNRESLDYTGTILQSAGTILLFGSLIKAQTTGFRDPLILICLLASAMILALFITFEQKHRQPLLDLSLFKNIRFSLNLVCALISFLCIAASSILLPFYLQDTLKLTPAHAGLFMMLSPLLLAILSPLFGSLSDRTGAEGLTLGGLILMTLGFFLMSHLNTHSSIGICALFVSVMAVGQALFQPANNSMIMSACSRDRLGSIGSINSLVRNLGQIAGITFSTTLLYVFMSQKTGRPVSDYIKGRDDVFVWGMSGVYLFLCVVCLAGTLLCTIRWIQAGKKSE